MYFFYNKFLLSKLLYHYMVTFEHYKLKKESNFWEVDIPFYFCNIANNLIGTVRHRDRNFWLSTSNTKRSFIFIYINITCFIFRCVFSLFFFQYKYKRGKNNNTCFIIYLLSIFFQYSRKKKKNRIVLWQKGATVISYFSLNSARNS